MVEGDMLQVFDKFREKLDAVMLKAFGHRVVLWGYGYTGRFLEWYAEYYHSIKVDFIITEDWSAGIPYNFPLFRNSLFDFNYMDVKNAIVWLATPINEMILEKLEKGGYINNCSYFDFLEIVYGKDYMCIDLIKDNRDVQFMEWLEYRYDCNLVTAINSSEFVNNVKGAHSYRISTQKEIFPILDKCHCLPQKNDAIFDFGCGKGGAMISFMDYGFKKVGGVEYEKSIYDIMVSNFTKLGIDLKENKNITCIHGDASQIEKELDQYNWFYYFDPFEREIFERTIIHICESLQRNPRKIHIININPKFHDVVLNCGFFELTNQFCIDVRQRVVDIFINKKDMK